jgi:hypothetical protein
VITKPEALARAARAAAEGAPVTITPEQAARLSALLFPAAPFTPAKSA